MKKGEEGYLVLRAMPLLEIGMLEGFGDSYSSGRIQDQRLLQQIER